MQADCKSSTDASKSPHGISLTAAESAKSPPLREDSGATIGAVFAMERRDALAYCAPRATGYCAAMMKQLLRKIAIRVLGPWPGDLHAMRAHVAERYLTGTGVEFGALHSALDVPESVTVKYADMEPIEQLRKSYPDVKDIRAPDFVTDLESMRGIDDGSMDFVIANHVMEHVEDPLRALTAISRVLRPSGIAFIALPDKRFTFDKDRAITPLAHLIKDREQGPDWSLADHYDEWCRCIDHLSGEAYKQKHALMLEKRTNIHFHVWDYPAMLELFSYVAKMPGMDLQVELSVLNNIEVIWILRKVAGEGTAS
jgi:SAM-dependent methyltransferase